MFNCFKTLNTNREVSTSDIEKKFESIRRNYLSDLNKIRKKYGAQFAKLASNYSNVCSTF